MKSDEDGASTQAVLGAPELVMIEGATDRQFASPQGTIALETVSDAAATRGLAATMNEDAAIAARAQSRVVFLDT